MLHKLVIGIWACLVSLASAYGGAYWRQRQSTPVAAHEEKLDVRKIKPITVPIILDGVLKGYVSAEFSLLGAKEDPHGGGLDPESFVMDEAFKLIYGESKIDFTHIDKVDLASLTSRIAVNVNLRLGKPAIKEVLVKNFTFVSRDDMPK